MRAWFVTALVLGALTAPVHAECIDPSTLVHSTVSITRYFDEGERTPNSLGIRGTAWFRSPTSMVTAEHVASAMKLTRQEWKQLEVVQGENKRLIAVRMLRVEGSSAEKIAILELSTTYAGAEGLQLRMEPLAAEESVVGLAYPNGRLRFASGRFARYADTASGAALFEMYDGEDRLVLDHGASGAPILDCKGRVVAVVSNLFTQTIQSPFRPVQISTAWGQPNIASVPIQVLKDYLSARQ